MMSMYVKIKTVLLPPSNSASDCTYRAADSRVTSEGDYLNSRRRSLYASCQTWQGWPM